MPQALLSRSAQRAGAIPGLQGLAASHAPATLQAPRGRAGAVSRRPALADAGLDVLPAAVAAPAAPATVAPAAAPVTSAPAISLPKADLPDLGAAQAQASKAAEAVAGNVTQVAAGVTDKAAELANAAGAATSQVTGAAGKAAAGLTAAVGGAASGVAGGITGLASSIGEGASGVAGQVSGTLGGALSGVEAGLGQAKAGLDQATAGVTGAVGQAAGAVAGTASSAAAAVGGGVAAAQQAVQQTVDAASAQAAAAAAQVAGAADAAAQQVLGALPPEVRDAAVAVGGAVGAGVGAAAAQAAEHPRAAAVVAAAVAVPSVLNYYKGRYGGFAGELSAQQVSALLAEGGNVFLVDIRPEAAREKEGLPALKSAARLKVAAFELQSDVVPPRVAREAANAEELRLLVNAAYITGLPQCQGGALTKVVVMDAAGGDRARALARALVSLGFGLSYVMEGGFRGWAEGGLPVLEDESEYDASAGAVLGDEIEAIAARAGEAAAAVSRPQVGLPLLGGGALAAYAVANYHTTLQFIGVLGVLATVANKLLSYDSPKEALDDIAGGVGGAAQRLAALRLPALPAAPKLPGGLPRFPAAAGAAAGGGGAGAGAAAAAASEAAEEEQEEQEGEVLEQRPQQ